MDYSHLFSSLKLNEWLWTLTFGILIYVMDFILLFCSQQGRNWQMRKWSSFWLARRTLRVTSTMKSLSGLSWAPNLPHYPSCHCVGAAIWPLQFYLKVLAFIFMFACNNLMYFILNSSIYFLWNPDYKCIHINYKSLSSLRINIDAGLPLRKK